MRCAAIVPRRTLHRPCRSSWKLHTTKKNHLIQSRFARSLAVLSHVSFVSFEVRQLSPFNHILNPCSSACFVVLLSLPLILPPRLSLPDKSQGPPCSCGAEHNLSINLSLSFLCPSIQSTPVDADAVERQRREIVISLVEKDSSKNYSF